ncbi:Vacuolar fusion protein CCZ1-like protein [Microtus ochrogaster]|uniref:Vacuolar fusion protein CCZ1-like protein n=1 Tax=Microtus ochrogaster TaxID=79684 RepID=A0A8J6GJ86_MICOH|nr:Vacuolar fusion protein CCZ1-like protein [Microtus ochrogaster]
MAAAAAGTGTWAAQEKQFPPALLSFFIYNPRFGPREGEVVRNPIIEKQSKDGKPVVEYQEEELLDKVYSSVLQQCYGMYKYLQTLHLQSCDLLDIFGGISFFPLDKMTYLKIQSFINRMEESLSIVKYTAFLYNDQLIWSGLEQDDMRILYKYLTTSLFPRHIEPEAMSAAVCFMIDASTQLTLEFCRRLDSIVGPQLTVLASDICEQFNINKRISGSEKEPQFKFIYFNHMNLAEKSTIHMRKTPSVSLTSVHPDLMKILGDINGDFTRADEDEEIIVKAMSDYWVVGKKSDQRELYVILNQKNANLIEVNEEVKKLCATQFNNIFFLD